MKEDWDKDELWDLLGNARPASVSPFFFCALVREIRRNPARPLVPLFLLRWLGAGALAVLAAGFLLNLGTVGTSSRPTKSADFTEVFDAAAGLEALLAVEDVSITNYTADL